MFGGGGAFNVDLLENKVSIHSSKRWLWEVRDSLSLGCVLRCGMMGFWCLEVFRLYTGHTFLCNFILPHSKNHLTWKTPFSNFIIILPVVFKVLTTGFELLKI